MQKKLGKNLGGLGLNELLSDLHRQTATPLPLYEQRFEDSTLNQIALAQLIPGKYQPRQHIDENDLQELADSIHAQGVIQPIVVRKVADGLFEIIAGERRWRAAKLVGLTEIPAIVRDISDEAAIAMALIENIQRRDLTALEEAQALERLMNEFNLTHQQVADAVGKSRTAVTNLLRLLKLNPTIQQFIYQQQLEMGHARALLTLNESAQLQAAEQIIQQGLSVRDTEQLVKRFQEDNAQPKKNHSTQHNKTPDDELNQWQHLLSDALSLPVNIQSQRGGKGKVVIAYPNKEVLQELLMRLQAI